MSRIIRISTPYSYSAAVIAGSQIYLGLHRGFGESFTEQLEGTFSELRETLGKVGLSLDCLVKVNVWLKHVEDLPTLEKLFTRYFEPDQFPARMTATTQFIDADCLLMIDGIGYTGD